MKNVLKICLVLILTLSMVFALVACGGEETTTDNGGDNSQNPSGPNVPGDENFNGGENNNQGDLVPLPEGGEDDPAADDIFD